MEWLYYYIMFAVSGAIVTWWAIFRPSVQLLAHATEGNHPMLRNQILSGLVWTSLATVALPVYIVLSYDTVILHINIIKDNILWL